MQKESKIKLQINYSDIIAAGLIKAGYKAEREYKFLEKRKFRFDIAIPELKIAIEFEGGVFSKGRHIRASGYIKDCQKYNLAVVNGWRLLRYTTADIKKFGWVDEIIKQVKDVTGDSCLK